MRGLCKGRGESGGNVRGGGNEGGQCKGRGESGGNVRGGEEWCEGII
jgi:hypothetical protein